MIEVMKQVSQGSIKITPDVFVGGGGDGASAGGSNVLAAFIASLMAGGLKLTPQEQNPKKS